MVEELLLRWVLTVGFAGTGCWFLVRGLRRAGVADRISSLAHVVMSAGMIAMAWPWGMSLPVPAQVVAFGAAALWFCVMLLDLTPAECCEGRSAHAHHALMMGAMVWMLVTMPDMPSGSGGGGGHHHHGNAASGALAPGTAEPGPSGLVFAVGLLAGAYFVLASLSWISSALKYARGYAEDQTGDAAGQLRERALDAACHAVMSLGAGTMLLTML